MANKATSSDELKKRIQWRFGLKYINLFSLSLCFPWCKSQFYVVGFSALLALAIYTGMTVNFFGKRYIEWTFSWSYIIGWIGTILTITAGKYLSLSLPLSLCKQPPSPGSRQGWYYSALYNTPS